MSIWATYNQISDFSAEKQFKEIKNIISSYKLELVHEKYDNNENYIAFEGNLINLYISSERLRYTTENDNEDLFNSIILCLERELKLTHSNIFGLQKKYAIDLKNHENIVGTVRHILSGIVIDDKRRNSCSEAMLYTQYIWDGAICRAYTEFKENDIIITLSREENNVVLSEINFELYKNSIQNEFQHIVNRLFENEN